MCQAAATRSVVKTVNSQKIYICLEVFNLLSSKSKDDMLNANGRNVVINATAFHTLFILVGWVFFWLPTPVSLHESYQSDFVLQPLMIRI